MSSRAARRRRSQAQHQRHMNKASYAAQARAAGARTQDMSAQANALATMQQGMPVGPYQPLPRQLPYNAPFGPLTPLPPYGIDPLRPDGRTNPRQYEYPVGWNIPGAGGKAIGWETLRAASQVDIIQDCMRVIRSELCGFDWGIVISEKAIAAAMESGGLRKTEAKQALRDQLAPEIAKAREFWENPDRDSDAPDFTSWLWLMMEDVLALDASAIYPNLTYGDELYALWVTDGTTWKPLLDNQGRRPRPPDPAYQQNLYGFPRGEARSPIGEDGTVEGGRSADELIYSVRNQRPFSPYGFGPVENALVRVNLWLKRADFMTKQFDANSLPLAFLELGESVDMQPAELRLWRQAINDQLSGDLAERQRIQLGLPGAKLTKFADNAELYRPEYDTYIVKLICASFGVTPAEIGFIESGGLGGASYHEGQENIQYRKLLLPWCRWLEGIFNRINRRYLGLDPAIEFRFLGLEEEDEAAADLVLDGQVKSGRLTLNEARDKMGLPPYGIVEADEPFVLYGRGVLFLDGQKELQESQIEAQKAGAEMAQQNFEGGDTQANAQGDKADGEDGPGPDGTEDDEQDEPPPNGDGKPAANGKQNGDTQKPVKGAEKSASVAELDSFARWAGKGVHRRPFAFTAVPGEVADRLNRLVLDGAADDAVQVAKATVAMLRKAGGGGGGRVESPRPERGAGGMARLPSPRRARAEAGGVRLPGCQPNY